MGSDADMNVIYANGKGRKMGNLVGKNLTEFHKPETIGVIEGLFKAFRNREKKLDHYKTDTPNGKITVVQFPFYAMSLPVSWSSSLRAPSIDVSSVPG